MWHCQTHFNAGEGGGVLGDESSRLLLLIEEDLAFGGDAGGVRGRRGEKGDGGVDRWDDLKGAGEIVSGFGILTPLLDIQRLGM